MSAGYHNWLLVIIVEWQKSKCALGNGLNLCVGRTQNPEYGSLGPRLSPPSELAVLSPDYLNEQGVIVGLLLLGWRDSSGAHHTVPRRVIPVGQEIFRVADEEVLKFHRDAGGQLRLHYFSQVVAHAGAFALPLLEAVLEQLERDASAEERQRFCVLRRSLAWQRTMGGMRL